MKTREHTSLHYDVVLAYNKLKIILKQRFQTGTQTEAKLESLALSTLLVHQI